MAAHFSGDICLALDRPIDGVEKLAAPTTSVAVTTGFEAAFHRGLTQTPPPDPLISDISLATSGSSRQARTLSIAARSERVPEAFRVLEGRSPRPSNMHRALRAAIG
jgi:hypothetical protein